MMIITIMVVIILIDLNEVFCEMQRRIYDPFKDL